MRKLFAYTTIALLATLTACSHGSNGALPGQQQTGNGTDALHEKMLREAQRIPSSFVAPKHPGYVAETPSVQTWPTGVQNAGEAPVPGGMFNIVNQYSAGVNGRHVTVYAGSLKETGAGIVLVVTRSADLHTARAQTYTVAPSAVRIVSAAPGQLQLQMLSGERRNVPFRMPL